MIKRIQRDMCRPEQWSEDADCGTREVREIIEKIISGGRYAGPGVYFEGITKRGKVNGHNRYTIIGEDRPAGYMICLCPYCGEVFEEDVEAPEDDDDMRDDSERIVTRHRCWEASQ